MKVYEFKIERTNGDSFSKFSFELEEIKKVAAYEVAHLAENEKEQQTACIIGHDINVEYEGTAEQLMTDLFNGDVECDEFDECIGSFTDASECFREEVL